VPGQVDDGDFVAAASGALMPAPASASSALPQTGASNSLADVSCNSAADCWAVGLSFSGSKWTAY
jgi:hypothetical protein